MQRPGQDPVAKDDVPWWMKYAGRGLGTVGSISKFTPAITNHNMIFCVNYFFLLFSSYMCSIFILCVCVSVLWSLSSSPSSPFSLSHSLCVRCVYVCVCNVCVRVSNYLYQFHLIHIIHIIFITISCDVILNHSKKLHPCGRTHIARSFNKRRN
jgi:hypothetical protein